MNKQLKWNVYIIDINSEKIKEYNIFNNSRLMDKLYKLKIKYKDDFENFSKEVKSWLMYFYWSKFEWEISLTEAFPRIRKEELNRLKNIQEDHYTESINLTCEKKIDVYDQIVNNWDIFIDYLWNNKKLIKRS